MKGNINVVVISESKLDKSFSIGQSEIPGYTCPFRLDRGQHSGWLMVFIREDIRLNFYLLNLSQLKVCI